MKGALRSGAVFVVAAASFMMPRAARAQSDTTATAEALFNAGKQLLDADRYAEACPKLAESDRLDPATGTELALAFCYERAGLTASAWVTYRDAAARARREGNHDREQVAREHASTIERSLSTLTIFVPADVSGVDGFTLRRDGVVLQAAAWGTPVPVDPGTHVIDASAPGKATWSSTVHVKAASDAQIVRVARLLDAAPSAPANPPAVVAPGALAPAASNATSERRSRLRVAGIVTGAAGLVGLGIGAVAGAFALQKNHDSRSDCTNNVCGPDGTESRREALRAADGSTAALIAGGVLTATGLTLFFVGRQADTPHASAAIGPGLARVSFDVAF